MLRALLLALLFLLPASTAHAAVVINEVAWMGTSVSANAEWIELANTGASSVDVSGWRLVSSSGSPDITLSGSIGAGGYYLLERTSDDTVSGVTADQVYTGSLTNSGATLTLSNTSGAVVETLAGGSNWESIGGNNATKETAQRSASGWITAPGTPRAANPGEAAVEEETTTSAAATPAASSYSPSPEAITVDIGKDKTVFTEVNARFSAVVREKGGKAVPSARVFWAFGDGSATEGREVEKIFKFPGAYMVSAKAVSGDAVAYDEAQVTVVVPEVRVATLTGAGITLANDQDAPLDISGWRLSSVLGSFRMPEGTMLPAENTVLFPTEITRIPNGTDAQLFYPSGALAARYIPPAPTEKPLPPSEELPLVQAVAPAPITRITLSEDAAQEVSAPRSDDLESSERGAAAAIVAENEVPTGGTALRDLFRSPWTYSVLGLILLAGGALLVL